MYLTYTETFAHNKKKYIIYLILYKHYVLKHITLREVIDTGFYICILNKQ